MKRDTEYEEMIKGNPHLQEEYLEHLLFEKKMQAAREWFMNPLIPCILSLVVIAMMMAVMAIGRIVVYAPSLILFCPGVMFGGGIPLALMWLLSKRKKNKQPTNKSRAIQKRPVRKSK